jgi:hypothetical protein
MCVKMRYTVVSQRVNYVGTQKVQRMTGINGYLNVCQDAVHGCVLTQKVQRMTGINGYLNVCQDAVHGCVLTQKVQRMTWING